MKVKFTAKIIDANGNVVGKRISEEDGIPFMEKFDLSTKEGFLRDFDLLEKAVLKARNQAGEDIIDEILDGTLKKLHVPVQETENRSRIRTWLDPCQRSGGYDIFYTAKGKDLQYWLSAALM